MLKIGIIGYGFVGIALKKWLDDNNPNVLTYISDPPKGINDNINDCDVFFIQIHIPTEKNGSQDLTLLKSILSQIPDGRPIWIRTTILPGTTAKLIAETGKDVHHMPEFLTQRTYIEDFKRQPTVFTDKPDLLKLIFPGKSHIIMTSAEAELAKYLHNVFGALKVTYFNCAYELCKKLGLTYDKVLSGVLCSGYINDCHTQVPGPDGFTGYGGKCFPKDVNAISEKYKKESFGKLALFIRNLNKKFRNTKEI